MLKKIIAFIIYFILKLSYSQLMCLPYYLIGNSRKGGNVAKSHLGWGFNPIYQIGFDSPIYYNGNYNKTNNIDIIIANHINTMDFALIVNVVKQFDDRNIYFILKKQSVFLPGMGFILLSAPDIKLNRKMEDDMDNIIRTIRKIKSGIFIIMPEGTRYTPEKYQLAKNHCIDNKLNVFENTLYPKMKGMWLICNILINEKRMGNIIDMSILVEKFRNKKAYMGSLLTKELGNSMCLINSYNVPKDGSIAKYDDFKKWFLDIWIIKDKLLNKMYTKNDDNLYSKLSKKTDKSEYLLAIIISSVFIYLIVKTKGIYLVGSLLITYIITFIKYKLLKKT